MCVWGGAACGSCGSRQRRRGEVTVAVALGVIGGSVGCCDALVGGWGTAAQKAAQRCCGVTGDSERDCEASVGMQGAERHS